MIEQWRDCIDDSQIGGAILTDLFKAFDIVNHDLLIAKLAANGFSHESLNLIRSYLTDRKQRIRINHTYSSYSDVTCGAPQGSILGPLLFNIDICDMLRLNSSFDIAGYVDDNTSSISGPTKH